MRIPGHELYQPLPGDPDMVLVHHDGLLMANLRGRIPKQLRFGEKYTKKLEGPLSNNFEVDRWLLSDLDRTAWGFRTEPASSVHSLRAAIATGDGTGKIQYGGTFRRPASGLSLRFETFLSDIEQFNYFGYGNDSLRPPAEGPSYRAEQKAAFATPTLRYELGRRPDASTRLNVAEGFQDATPGPCGGRPPRGPPTRVGSGWSRSGRLKRTSASTCSSPGR
jgi:hypothetical protein